MQDLKDGQTQISTFKKIKIYHCTWNISFHGAKIKHAQQIYGLCR